MNNDKTVYAAGVAAQLAAKQLRASRQGGGEQLRLAPSVLAAVAELAKVTVDPNVTVASNALASMHKMALADMDKGTARDR
jgi:hypothetical protein